MGRFQLREVVLLRCDFDAVPETSESATTAAEEIREGWPDEDVLDLELSVRQDDDLWIAFFDGTLDDPRLGFTLSLSVGAAFEMEGDDQPDVDDAAVASTLTFMAFPFVRQFVADVTARSPVGPYMLPPMGLPPQPPVADEEPPADVVHKAES